MSAVDSGVRHAPPHRDAPAANIRRGSFWLTGDVVEGTRGPRLFGSSYVQWEAPGEQSSALPVVLIHGGGGQATDWLITPDGRPGWAPLLVERGHPVYVVDRPGYGRSTYLQDLQGSTLPPLDYAGAAELFVPKGRDAIGHSAWPWDRTPGTPELDAVVAAAQPFLADTELSNQLDQARVVDLLDRIGPAIIITHSAGAPAGWLAADARPHLVAALIAVEPLGPVFKDLGARGTLKWGLTASPITFDPKVDDPDNLRKSFSHTLVRLKDVPVAVVSADTSGRRANDEVTAAFLQKSGVTVDHILLSDHGVQGNGHGVIFEANNQEALRVLLRWTDGVLSNPCNLQINDNRPMTGEKGRRP